jgi:hypothetical protein
MDDDLLAQVRLLAARSGRTMTAVIEDALREMLSRQGSVSKKEPVKLTTVSGHGLQPGIDLDDSAALLEIMEKSNDPA